MSADIEELQPAARLLSLFPKVVAHLRTRHAARRLTLVMGAGVSSGLALPPWTKLVELIARHPAVRGTELIVGNNPAENTERLYQHFCDSYKAGLSQQQSAVWRERTCDAKWKDIVRTCLYAPIIYPDHVPENLTDQDCREIELRLNEAIPRHPYLGSVYQIVREAPYTITYNFDDVMERLISISLTQRERTAEGRGYETFVSPAASSRRRNARIYHPNGFLPLNKLETSSDAVALRESDLIGQLLPKHELTTSFLRAHIRTHTTLLVGMSFSDLTQRVLYQENREHLPGNIHYHLDFQKPEESARRRAQSRQAARELAKANFKALGVLSVPLFADEFGPFFQLLTMDDEHLIDLASEHDVPMIYRYYLVGAPGSGKSSVLTHLNSLVTHDEWPDPRPNILGRAPETLNEEETRFVNGWLNRQFRMKNRRLLRAEIGIHVVDRSPLDTLTYQPPAMRHERARELKRELRNPVASGHVFRFKGDDDVLALRLIALHKDLSPDSIGKLAEATETLYSGHGVTEIDTRERSLLEVVREVTELIHLHEKQPKNLESLLTDACKEPPDGTANDSPATVPLGSPVDAS